jgi:hypothetical protein
MDRTLMVILITPVIGFATALTLNRILALTLTLSRHISPGKQERASPALVQVCTDNQPNPGKVTPCAAQIDVIYHYLTA